MNAVNLAHPTFIEKHQNPDDLQKFYRLIWAQGRQGIVDRSGLQLGSGQLRHGMANMSGDYKFFI